MSDKFDQSRKGLLTIFFSRVTYIVLALIVQLLFLIVLIVQFKDFSFYVESFLVALSVLMVIWILNQDTLVDFKIAWLIPILAFPVFGGMLYLILGGSRIKHSERQRLKKIDENAERTIRRNVLQDTLSLEGLNAYPISAVNQSSYLTNYTKLPAYRHTQTEYFSSGEAYCKKMLEDIANAEEFIFLEYFIIEKGVLWEQLLDLLTKKASQGLDVRVIYDDIGTITRLPRNYPQQLEELGIRCAVFSPFHPILTTRFNNRDHRKITVIDGYISYTGGVNLADEYINEVERFGHWKDNGIRLCGPATASFTVMFLSMWDYLTRGHTETSQFLSKSIEYLDYNGIVQPFSDSPIDGEAVSESVYRNLIGQATKSVYIFTPYLVLADELQSAICNAAKRGVAVHIITPQTPDKWYVQALGRASYHTLVNARVHVYEYTPGFVHSKAILVDDAYAVVGTINMDYRSLYLHFECGVWLYQTPCLQSLKEDFLLTIQNSSVEITQENLSQVPLIQKLGRSLLRIFAPLM